MSTFYPCSNTLWEAELKGHGLIKLVEGILKVPQHPGSDTGIYLPKVTVRIVNTKKSNGLQGEMGKIGAKDSAAVRMTSFIKQKLCLFSGITAKMPSEHLRKRLHPTHRRLKDTEVSIHWKQFALRREFQGSLFSRNTEESASPSRY